jgi:hypothetical protein
MVERGFLMFREWFGLVWGGFAWSDERREREMMERCFCTFFFFGRKKCKKKKCEKKKGGGGGGDGGCTRIVGRDHS